MNTENNYTETDLGNVAPNPRGEFSEAEEYEYLDYVYYQGGSYLCLAELGTTIVGLAPEPGKTTQYWQAVALPGGLTPEYVAMHDRVVNLSEQAEADAEEVRESKENIEGMETNVENLQSQSVQSAQEAEESKTQAAGYASAAEASRQAAAESEANVNAQVTGFDAHVSEKTDSAEADIEAARIAANAAVVAQQEESVQAVKDQTAAYIANKQAEAEEVVENKAQEYGTNVDADIKTINIAGDVQVQAVNAAGTTQVGNVNSAGAVQITAVENAGVAQVSLVSAAGTEQKNAVKSEGATQVANVQEAAAEIISDREQIQQNKQDIGELKGGLASMNIAEEAELIETINVEDDTLTIERTLEPDGTPYKFKAIICLCQLKDDTNDGYILIDTFLNKEGYNQNALSKTKSTYTWANVNSPDMLSNYWIIRSAINCGLLETVFYQPSSNPGAPSFNPIFSNNAIIIKDGNFIERLKLTRSIGIKSGSVIHIYGVRA